MLEGKKVLLVDDDPEVVALLTKHFAAAGAIVEGAGTFEAGFEAITKNKPDIAVVDLMLAGRSGMDLVKAVQGQPTPHPFFAILTNSTDVVNIAEAVEINVTTFLQKADHDPKEIVEIVARHYTQKV